MLIYYRTGWQLRAPLDSQYVSNSTSDVVPLLSVQTLAEVGNDRMKSRHAGSNDNEGLL